MLIKKRFGSLQNDLKKKALLALAATGIAFVSLGGIAVAQEAGMESDFVMAAMAEESSALFASSEDINQALLSSGLEADGSGFIPIVQSTIVASTASTSVNSLASVLATADPAAWSNPVDITIASTTVADPSQFNSLASVLAAAETATGANGGTVTSVNAGDSTPWWAVSLIVFGATATLMALTYFAMSMVAAARRPSLSPMGA